MPVPLLQYGEFVPVDLLAVGVVLALVAVGVVVADRLVFGTPRGPAGIDDDELRRRVEKIEEELDLLDDEE